MLEDLLNTTILTVADKPLTVANVVFAVVVLLAGWAIHRMGARAFDRAEGRAGADQRLGVARRLFRYVVGIGAILGALSALGIDLATLFTAGALFAVGVGFAMQDIAQNFVAGVILLVERNIKPGDVVDVEGRFIRIREMGIRSTIAWTRDHEEIIIPNSLLAQTVVKNYTLTNSVFRVRASVGVTYGSDMAVVKKTLFEVGQAIPWREKEHEPLVLMTTFGDNSVTFELILWSANPWEARPALSMMNEAIWDAFQAKGIVIAFPQLDVHLDDAVVDKLAASIAKRAS